MKRWISILLISALLAACCGCHATSYEDTNGSDDFSLQTLTEEDILHSSGSTRIMSSTVTLNSQTTCKVKTMSGVVELYSRRMDGGYFGITVSSQVTKGNARLVLIVNDEIVHEFDLNRQDQYFALGNVSGKVSLKIAGESTGYNITFTVD